MKGRRSNLATVPFGFEIIWGCAKGSFFESVFAQSSRPGFDQQIFSELHPLGRLGV